MKKNLLLMMCCPVILSAQNGVTVSGLDVKSGTVTFNVSWKNTDMPTLWSDSVWVFVDYNNAGKMERLPVADATVTAGSVVKAPNNTNGVWVVGNAKQSGNSSGSFSTTVQLLTDTDNLSGVCAYASNYPPVGKYIDVTQIKFTGTPMYEIVLDEIGGEGTLTDYSDGTYTLREGYTVKSFTDATGAPGIMNCIVPTTYNLQASASGFCAGSAGVQLALSDTENGRYYQLYRDGVAVDGVALEGNGNAATFTGSFDEAGTYTAWTIADDKYCAIAMNGTHVVVENPLPVLTVKDTSRECAGTVTLTASSSPGAVIDWYADAAATTTLHTGENYTTPEIATSTTYYAQAWFEHTGCLSAMVSVSATVNMEGCCTTPGSTVTFAEFDPCANAAMGTVWYLIDTRESDNIQLYKVKKMADGHIWMVRDLKFGSGCEKNNGSSSNASNIIQNGYYGDCWRGTDQSSNKGYVYTWQAAVQVADAYRHPLGCSGTASGTASGAPATCQGICPAGWHIPTSNTDGEYLALFNASGCTSNTVCSDLHTSMELNNIAFCDGSRCYEGIAQPWPATSCNTGAAYYYGLFDGNVSCNYGKDWFRTVRCVMNY